MASGEGIQQSPFLAFVQAGGTAAAPLLLTPGTRSGIAALPFARENAHDHAGVSGIETYMS